LSDETSKSPEIPDLKEKMDPVKIFAENAIQNQLIGKVIDGRFAVQSLLGTGATSSVYKALDSEKQRTVAIKVLHEHLAVNESLLSRFQREAKSAKILSHPNIAAVYDYAVSTDGTPYLIMEFADGETLSDVLNRVGYLPADRAIGIFFQICAALSAAHERSVIHRDLKPSNVILSTLADGSDFVKVLDFGCAQMMPMLGDTVLRLTQTGELLGSLLYMSPEQCLEEDADERSDVYSLGCVMYEVLTGKPALAAKTAFETMNKHMSTMPNSFAIARPDLSFPRGLEKIIFRCIAKAPDARYQTIASLMSELEAISLTSIEPVSSVSLRQADSAIRPLSKQDLSPAELNAKATVTFILVFAIGALITQRFVHQAFKDGLFGLSGYEVEAWSVLLFLVFVGLGASILSLRIEKIEKTRAIDKSKGDL